MKAMAPRFIQLVMAVFFLVALSTGAVATVDVTSKLLAPQHRSSPIVPGWPT